MCGIENWIGYSASSLTSKPLFSFSSIKEKRREKFGGKSNAVMEI